MSKIYDIIKHKKVKDLIYVTPEETVGECLGRLDDNHIHSVALVDQQEKRVIGLVDYLDLVVYLLNVCVKKMESRVTPASENLTTDDFDLILKRSNEFHLRSIPSTHLSNQSKKDPLYEVDDSQPLWYVCEVFALGLHRVVIKDEKGNRTVFSQSDVVSWYSVDTEKKLGDLCHQTVKELGLGNKNMVTINENDKAIDAFFKMRENQVSGLGVVNDEGELVGNFSSSDLKGIRHFNFYSLLNSVKEYIHLIRKKDQDHKTEVVWVIESTPFSTVLKKFAERRVHRIYCVHPETMKPISVITLTDVLSKIPFKEHN